MLGEVLMMNNFLEGKMKINKRKFLIICASIFLSFIVIGSVLVVVIYQNKAAINNDNSNINVKEIEISTYNSDIREEETMTDQVEETTKDTEGNTNSIETVKTVSNTTQIANTVTQNTIVAPEEETTTEIPLETILASIKIQDIYTGKVYTGNELYNLRYAYNCVTESWSESGGLKVIADPYDAILSSVEINILLYGAYSSSGTTITIDWDWQPIATLSVRPATVNLTKEEYWDLMS